MKTIRILDLFAGTQSVRKAVFELYGVTAYGLDKSNIWVGFGKNGNRVEYAGFDIYSPEKQNIHFDLSQDNIIEKIIEKLPKWWTPDFIWNSPVCNWFSSSNTGINGNYYFIVENDEIRIRDKDFGIGVTRNYKNFSIEQHKEKIAKMAPMALKLHNNGKKIINHFKVPFAIENPSYAMSRFIYKEYITNTTNYCMYGYSEFSKKSTNIYSNIKLNLLKCNHKGKHPKQIQALIKNGAINNYANRSAVPTELIKQIIKESVWKN